MTAESGKKGREEGGRKHNQKAKQTLQKSYF